MDLNGENIKKIRGLILFTAVLVVCLWKYDVVFSVLKFILGVTFPFILGGAFAFVLNVPMNFLQRHLFPRKITQKSRALQKLARPASLVLVLLLVAGVVGLVLFVLIPQLFDQRHDVFPPGQASTLRLPRHFLLEQLHGIHRRIDHPHRVPLHDKGHTVAARHTQYLTDILRDSDLAFCHYLSVIYKCICQHTAHRLSKKYGNQ